MLIILLIVLIFFLVYIALINKKRLLPIKKFKFTSIKNKQLQGILSNNYYFSIWYNIQGIKQRSAQYNLISWLLKSQKNNDTHEQVVPLLSKFSLVMGYSLSDIHIYFNNESSPTKPIPLKVNDLPLDGWNNIIISVNQNIVDVYINGELRKTLLSNALGKAIAHGSNKVCLGSDFLNGFYGNVVFGKDTLSTEDAYNIYKKGLGENNLKELLDRYRIKTTILRKKNVMGSLEL